MRVNIHYTDIPPARSGLPLEVSAFPCKSELFVAVPVELWSGRDEERLEKTKKKACVRVFPKDKT